MAISYIKNQQAEHMGDEPTKHQHRDKTNGSGSEMGDMNENTTSGRITIP